MTGKIFAIQKCQGMGEGDHLRKGHTHSQERMKFEPISMFSATHLKHIEQKRGGLFEK